MKCCGKECWAIWHPAARRNVAWGCRLCDTIHPAPDMQQHDRWARCEWRRYKGVFSGRDMGYGKPFSVSPAARPVITVMYPDGTKSCSKCHMTKNLTEFRVDKRRPEGGKGRFHAACRECERTENRRFSRRQTEENRKRGLRTK